MPVKIKHRSKQANALSGPISMQQVAVHAGVSRSAVSLALQHHPSIPASTRERIRAAAQELGYRPNPLVTALMRSRRTAASASSVRASLGFLTADAPTDRWRDATTHRNFHTAATTRAIERGFSLEEFSASDPQMRPERLIDLLQARGIHGILVAPLTGQNNTLPLNPTGFSIVGLGTSVQAPEIDRVADDHFYAAQLAYTQAQAIGYRRIGFALAADVSRRLEHRWLSGYLVAQQQYSPRTRIPVFMPETRDEIPLGLSAWIARHRVDAVIFALRDQNKMSCAPIGTGLISLSVHEEGQVTGIRQDEFRIGAEAIDLLVEKLQRWETGSPRGPRFQLVRGVWCTGLSAPGAGLRRQALLPEK
jgi:DNA-binding LacI/PurR family transcriptional regulator